MSEVGLQVNLHRTLAVRLEPKPIDTTQGEYRTAAESLAKMAGGGSGGSGTRDSVPVTLAWVRPLMSAMNDPLHSGCLVETKLIISYVLERAET